MLFLFSGAGRFSVPSAVSECSNADEQEFRLKATRAIDKVVLSNIFLRKRRQDRANKTTSCGEIGQPRSANASWTILSRQSYVGCVCMYVWWNRPPPLYLDWTLLADAQLSRG